MSDVVVLDKGVVVDAVFRSAKRRYSGASSSPHAIPAADARKAKATRTGSGPGTDGPVTFSISGKNADQAATAKSAKKPPQ
jgi:hypothetical protein